MNPLSSHPPRTPRASLVASHSHVYGTNIYESSEEKEDSGDMGEDVEEKDDKVLDIRPKVRKEDIWREMILTSVGRDKAFVGILYSAASLAFSLIFMLMCYRN